MAKKEEADPSRRPFLFYESAPDVDDARYRDRQGVGSQHKRIDYDLLWRFCQIHPSDEEIAQFFQISLREFNRRRALDPVIQAMIDKGFAAGKTRLRKAMWTNALDGMNTTMQMHLGKHVLGQTDKHIIQDERAPISKEEAKAALRAALDDIERDMVDATPAITHDASNHVTIDVVSERSEPINKPVSEANT